jgi:dolichol-phosphate mannosyltransferase
LFWYAVTALTSFSSLPLHIVTLTGGLFLLVAVTLGCWSLVRWALGTAVSGFTTVILLQLFIGSILMVSLGIIGQYLAHIYAEVKRRPRYVVAEKMLDNVAESRQPAMRLKAAG